MSELDAGRELDALVAEKVMGLVIVARDWPCGYDPDCGAYQARYTLYPAGAWTGERGPVYVPDGGTWPPVETSDAEFARLGPGFTRADLAGTDWVLPHAHVLPIPFYSTDLEAAWGIVTERTCQPYRWRVLTDTGWDASPAQRHYCRIESPGGAVGAHAETMPLALCRAALLAVRL